MTRQLIVSAAAAIVCAGFFATYRANAQPPKPDAPAAGDKPESPDVQCAKAYLDAARLELKLLLNANKLVPGSATKEKLTMMARFVALADASYDAAVAEQNGASAAAVYIKYAENVAKAAEAAYEAAIKAHRLGVKSKVEFERLASDAQLARLRVEKAKALAGKDAAAFLPWKVDFLNEQLMRVLEL